MDLQALFLNPPRIRYDPSPALNPATLLVDPSSDGQHEYSLVQEHTQNIRLDLTDIPWLDVERIYFTDGSSFIQNRIGYAGVVVMTWTLLFEQLLCCQ